MNKTRKYVRQVRKAKNKAIKEEETKKRRKLNVIKKLQKMRKWEYELMKREDETEEVIRN